MLEQHCYNALLTTTSTKVLFFNHNFTMLPAVNKFRQTKKNVHIDNLLKTISLSKMFFVDVFIQSKLTN